tara:strand:+ start:297 stop:725 length:429 start_codon:yes stop_codon:yes gene_type:complete
MPDERKMRGVVIHDIITNAGVLDLAKLHGYLEESVRFFEYIVKKDPDLAQKVCFEKNHVGIPMSERRGLTGPLEEIVWRGTRGPNSSTDRAQLPDKNTMPLKFMKRLYAMRKRMEKKGVPLEAIQEKMDAECIQFLKKENDK